MASFALFMRKLRPFEGNNGQFRAFYEKIATIQGKQWPISRFL
jgi:hypothetical protein